MRKMKLLLIAGIGFATISLNAYDFSGYKSIATSEAVVKAVDAGDMQITKWNIRGNPAAAIINNALVITNKDGNSSAGINREIKLENGKNYFLTVEINIVEMSKGGFRCYVETYRNKQFVSGAGRYSDYIKTTGKRTISVPFRSQNTDADYLAGLNLEKGTVGKVEVTSVKMAAENQFDNLDFELGNKQWNISANATVASPNGRNGTSGLKIAEGCKGSRAFTLPPNVKYRVGGWIRTEDIKGEGAAIAFELFDAKGNFISGRGKYLKPVSGTSDWTQVETSLFTDKDPNTKYMLSAYLRPKTTGTAYFDDIYIIEEKPQWLPYLLYPKFNAVNPEDATLKLQSAIAGRFDYAAVNPADNCVLGVIEQNGVAVAGQVAMVGADGITLNFGKLNISGNAVLVLTLFDRANKIILSVKKIDIVIEKNSPKVTVDKLGRTIVDGKPFLPLGLYGYGLSKEDVKIISDSPFNAFLPYPSLFLDIDGPKGQTAQPSLEKLNAALQFFNDNGIKIIFSVKDLYDGYKYAPAKWNDYTDKNEIAKMIVDGLKDNPGLLMWYIADEQNPEWVPKLKERRQLINKLDKNHPVLSVFYQFSELPMYGECQDILGTDAYPVKLAKDNHMKNVYDTALAAGKAQSVKNIPVGIYGVPQIHNQGLYEADKDDYAAITQKYRYPSQEEILAMSLMEAIYGARGFIFYSYHDLRRGPDTEQFNRRWPQICAAVKKIKDLEKFLLSDNPAEEVSFQTDKGKVAAKKFIANDKTICVMIAAVGPGESEAAISNLPTNLISKCGKTKYQNGKYMFSSKDISCDILLSSE